MSYQWRPPESGRKVPNGLSNISSFTPRNSFRNAIPIPIGTVASRVNLLQSLSKSSPIKNLPQSPNRRRGESSLGFGRRPNNRFAAPASRKAIPDDHHEIETAHSFLGLKATRTNHEEGHASYVAEHRTTKPQIKDSAVGKELDKRIHTAQQGSPPVHVSISKIRSSESAKRAEDRHLVDFSKSQTSQCDQTERCMPISASKSQSLQQTGTQWPGTLGSESSTATTSTMRRQSVRELFHDYGIERPAGFASPRNTSEEIEESARRSKAHVCCHVCSFTNKHVQVECQKCGHHFCSDCPAFSVHAHNQIPQASTSTTPPKQKNGNPDVLPNGQASCQVQTKQDVTRPDPCPIQRPKNKFDMRRVVSSPPIKFPSFNSGIPVRGNESTKASLQNSNSSIKLKAHQSSGTKAMTNVKDSDQKSSTQPLQASPVVQRSSRRFGGAWEVLQYQQCSSNSSLDEANCDSLGCQSTHDGHKPYRHAVACTKRMTQDGGITGTGYTAETSRVDEIPLPQHNEHPYFSRPHSRSSRRSLSGSSHSHISRPSSAPTYQESSVPNDYQVPEYVECHGYPRTGHGRCGSPVDSGIIGECQHCLNDCECLACQNTYHAVRCCTHKDHPSIPHTHRTSQISSRISQSTRYASTTSALDEAFPVSPFSVPHNIPEYQESSLLPKPSEPERASTMILRQMPAMKEELKPPSNYPVAPMDNKSDLSKPAASIKGRQNAISITKLSDQNNNRKGSLGRESCTLSFEQLKALKDKLKEFQGSGIALRRPEAALDSNDGHPSPFSKPIKNRSLESLKLQAKQREQRKERLRPRNMNQDITSKNGESKLARQLDIIKGEEKKEKSYEEKKIPKETTLFLDYKIGRKSRKGRRQPSPLCPKERLDVLQKPPNNNLGDDRREEASDTSNCVRDLEKEACEQKGSVKKDKKEHFEAMSNATGILGITVIVHMSNREDLVFKVDASMAANPKTN